MSKTVKFAVSLPDDEYKEMEVLRKKRGLTRSAFVRKAIMFLKKRRETEKLIKQYLDGYRRTPEDVAEISALEKASYEVLTREDWK
jgi:metal-responsive CopG/Arc/MetJ family transcriptional regulator